MNIQNFFTSLPDKVKIVEVGPRDGLQSEPKFLATEDKISFIEQLSQTGLKHIEATSFVSPKWIPQLSDHQTVFQNLKKKPDVHYPVLVPNLLGFENAFASGVKEIALFTAASDSFTRKNIACTIDESFNRFELIAKAAVKNNVKIRGYVSCIVACPYEGKIAPQRVIEVTKKLLDLGCYEISLGDTLGVGTPAEIVPLFDRVMKSVDKKQLAAHFHNTFGQAIANIFSVLQLGISIFDSAVAGLGGCPYAKGASGNVATEDVVFFMHGLNIQTGIDLKKLIAVGEFICEKLHRRNESKVALAKGLL